MLKSSAKIIFLFSFLTIHTAFSNANEQALCQAVANQESETDLALFRWLQELDPQNSDLFDLIRSHFETDNQEVLNFIAEKTDHVNLEVTAFKKHFTNQEIQQILDFHASAVGQKFGTLFPSVMQDYKHALENQILAIKAAIIAYAKTQQTQLEQPETI